MSLCCPLVIYLASMLASNSPAREAPTPALELLLGTPPSIPANAFAQGTQTSTPPTWFISVSGNYIDGDSVGPLGDSSDKYEGLGLDIGYTNWNEQLGVTLEGGYLGSTTEFDISSIETEDVNTHRFLFGLRLFDRGSDWWLPYLRGGFMWRLDSGDQIDDDGAGWYAGGGFDFYLGKHLRIGPQLLYTDSESLNTTEWILGGVLSLAF